MKQSSRFLIPLLVVVVGSVLSGCSADGKSSKKERTYVDDTQYQIVKTNYPDGYQYSETWKGTERGGAALRHPGYEHALVSPYAEDDRSGRRNVPRDLNTQILLTSVSKTQYANGPRGTFTQATRFCDENTHMLPKNTQRASRTEYMQIKERYCSTPGYRLSQHEIDVLNGGEPEELRQYRVNMFIDNQFNKKP